MKHFGSVIVSLVLFPGARTLRAAADGAGQKINSDSSAKALK